MSIIDRRSVLRGLGGAAALAACPGLLRAGATPQVVVVGGGFAGASVARYLRDWSAGSVAVTLVEANASHVSCILSNLVLNNSLALSDITFDYDRLQSVHGVQVVRAKAKSINTAKRKLKLDDGSVLKYDRLVLAPGIDFDVVPGLDSSLVPHAWKAGKQTQTLRDQLQAMPAGGSFVMSIPQTPYRCPPGPYERACVVADYLRRNKPGSSVIVLDANPDIVAEKATFSKAFTQTYANMLEYRPNTVVEEVDSANRLAYTSGGPVAASVLNVIPRQKAPALLANNGLVNDASGRWAGVNPLSYESTALPAIHVIGDAQATAQPKAGHIANAEAKVCADAILRAFAGLPPDPAPVTNSACFSPITASTASWLTVVFQYDAATATMKSVSDSSGEASAPSKDNYEQMFDWARNLFADTFDQTGGI